MGVRHIASPSSKEEEKKDTLRVKIDAWKVLLGGLKNKLPLLNFRKTSHHAK